MNARDPSEAETRSGDGVPGPPRREPYNVLFVCTGNTCRSPLAEALARREARERGWRQIAFRSAGIAAGRGVPASVGSRRIAGRHGLDLSKHASRRVDEELVRWADVILCMTRDHVDAVAGIEGGEEKAELLARFAGSDRIGDVTDPVGGGEEAYDATYRQLEWLVSAALDRLEPVVAP